MMIECKNKIEILEIHFIFEKKCGENMSLKYDLAYIDE